MGLSKEAMKNRIDYIREYNKSKYVRIGCNIKSDDEDFIEWLKAKPSTSQFLVDLARKEYEKERQ